ncbi:MAG: Rha family transcriptional regulator [Campylobacterales bacterium]|nr:Rha family transcriptional regulator [Campylobacterales bacterium]
MNELIKLEFVEGEARVSHDLIAKGMGLDAISVRKLIDAHSEDFESFGVLSFEMTKPPEGSSGGRPQTTYYLNEQQATLAMTYMRNSEQARAFKMALVRAFYAMKSKLEGGMVGGGNALELLAASQKQLAEGFTVMAGSIKALSDGQAQIIELISQLQSNTPLRYEGRIERLGISEVQKQKFVCLNPELHDNPEEREMFTVNVVEILKRYPSGLFQGMLLSKSDYPSSARTRRWLQDGIGEFWNMELRPGRGYLYFI